jgi:hypothetical protein
MEHAGPIAFLLVLVYPTVFLLGSAGLLPRLPVDFWFELAFIGGIFVVSLLSVPLAIAGLRTSYRGISAVALLIGSIEAAVHYWVKFHPWVERAFGID